MALSCHRSLKIFCTLRRLLMYIQCTCCGNVLDLPQSSLLEEEPHASSSSHSSCIPPNFGAPDFRNFSSFRLRMALHMLTKMLRKQGVFESTQCNFHHLFAIEDVLWPLIAAVHSHKSKGHPPPGRPWTAWTEQIKAHNKQIIKSPDWEMEL